MISLGHLGPSDLRVPWIGYHGVPRLSYLGLYTLAKVSRFLLISVGLAGTEVGLLTRFLRVIANSVLAQLASLSPN